MKFIQKRGQQALEMIWLYQGIDVGSIIKVGVGGGAQVLMGTLKNFLKSVRDCFVESRVAATE